MRLVDDDRVVPAQQRIRLELSQQEAIGHEHEPGGGRDLVGEPHAKPDDGADRLRQLVGDARRERPGRETPRLRMGDESIDAAARLEAELR